jgi:hypothetical protein
MLRRSAGRGQRHTVITRPKFSDKPGMWGTHGGPPKDTLARRTEFYRKVFFNRVGKLTKPFRTPTVKWIWRRFTWNLFRASVAVMMFTCAAMILQIWIMVTYHAYAVGKSTPVLERKVREHRVSKQVLQMVRTRERDITQQAEMEEVKEALAKQK